MWNGFKTNCETGSAELGPTEEVEQPVGAGQLAAHQPLPLHHAARLPSMQVVDGRHHHHVCKPDGGEKYIDIRRMTLSFLFYKRENISSSTLIVLAPLFIQVKMNSLCFMITWIFQPML